MEFPQEPTITMKLISIFAARFLILAPMAFCIALVLVSEDKMLRLGALIALILLEQARDWMLLSSMRGLAKDNKHLGE